GTAGLYGAISVIPVLEYKNGDYSIEGTATMAAGARLKLSLNAWAEVEALWVTVWENTWELASITMPVGPDLGLQAKMAYTFGSPMPPTLEFKSSDIDTDKLISDAMPKDGPPKAGVRDQVKNQTKWQGAQRAKGKDADKVPADQAAKANAKDTVPQPAGGKAPAGRGAPPKAPGGKDKKPDKDQKAAKDSNAPVDPKKAKDRAKDAATPDKASAGTVPDDQAASTKTPRHGPISKAMLKEPPVPMPRTKAQQAADVKAAAALVRLLAQDAKTTDALDNHFPKIKERFKLSQIGYVLKGGVLKVRVKVNNEGEITMPPAEVQNLPAGITGDELKTKVSYKTDSFTYPVGVNGNATITQAGMGHKMIADPLTPYHSQGSGPKGGTLKQVFSLLPTQGSTGSEGYIRGHLLNDNLGGPGEDRNLFPITQIANSRHNSEIEADAKKIVNDQHYYVRYTVQMKQEDNVEPYTYGGKNFVVLNSTIHATLEVLKSDMKITRHVKSVVIPSRFNKLADADRPETAALGAATKKELEAVAIVLDARIDQMRHQAAAASRESKAYWDAKSAEVVSAMKTFVQAQLRGIENERMASRLDSLKSAYEMFASKVREVAKQVGVSVQGTRDVAALEAAAGAG
ncbi:MAG: DNA/RNA non-specific endonuclease, partial [Rhodobacteraceae bacterium]|nr:DNA/RNA non-specific endonuclease [Paracoccaceae bacterium]